MCEQANTSGKNFENICEKLIIDAKYTQKKGSKQYYKQHVYETFMSYDGRMDFYLKNKSIKTKFMIECKQQTVSGSTDEKLCGLYLNAIFAIQKYQCEFIIIINGKGIRKEIINKMRTFDNCGERLLIFYNSNDWTKLISVETISGYSKCLKEIDYLNKLGTHKIYNYDSSIQIFSPIKWAGGKQKLIETYCTKCNFPQKIENDTTYIEPFLGGGSVLFALRPKNIIINDINRELIEMYKMIQDEPFKLTKHLYKMQKMYNETIDKEKYYYLMRDLFNKQKKSRNISQPIMSSIFLFLNKSGFRGLYRENSSGEFNVPFGNYPKIKFDYENIFRISDYLNWSHAQIYCKSYEKILLNYVNGKSVIFLDPPYAPIISTSFTKYNSSDFGQAEHEKLYGLVKTIFNLHKNCDIFLANSPNKIVEKYFEKDKIYTFSVSRAIDVSKVKKGTDNETLLSLIKK